MIKTLFSTVVDLNVNRLKMERINILGFSLDKAFKFPARFNISHPCHEKTKRFKISFYSFFHSGYGFFIWYKWLNELESAQVHLT